MEILLAILQENLALALGGVLIIAAFVRHLVTKDPGHNRPSDDDDYEDEREDWWMNPGNDMGFFERHDD
jgi:hypothetical protein